MRYNDMPLEELIPYLMSIGKEGDFWDFKQEWHDKTEDLLKDIICFANTVHDENCYLIFGVSNDLQITGMHGNRRKQADIIDALSNLNFAGDSLPHISVEMVQIQNIDLDVLIIYDTDRTPIYLKKPYGNMNAGCIYTRVGDRNTPDKGNAEIGDIENLWKKRLGLTKPPYEYILDRLQNKLEWAECDGHYYNIYKPEYTLNKYMDADCYDREPEFYSYAQTNETTSYQTMDIMVNGTVVASRQLVSLDSGRLTFPEPEWGSVHLGAFDTDPYFFKYYAADSPCYKILRFLYNPEDTEERWAFRNLMDVVLLFESEEERKYFANYIEMFAGDQFKAALEKSDEYDYIQTALDSKTELFKKNLRTGVVLNKMLIEWREMQL